MGLDDRDALSVLRAAVDEHLAGDCYAHWFARDPAVRDLFPPDMARQRAVFAQALGWLFGELVAQRADEPVAFLAQLGRDHRKYGVTAAHFDGLGAALLAALRTAAAARWDARVADAAGQAIALMVGVMRGAADADEGPPYRDATVVEHLRVTRDVSVVRLRLDGPLHYHPGQYVTVQVPQWPRRWRYLSPSIPADPDGWLEFHVRSVAGGMVSTAIVAETRPGDRWRVSSPHGGLRVDRDGGDVLMVAGGTGLAPLRSIVMDLARFGVNPRVHLFFGARFPCDLYDLRTLWEVAAGNPWLSVTPVSEYATDPPWAGDFPDVTPPRGLHVRQTGRLPEVVTRYGSWGDRQILLAGSAAMIRATRAALAERGADPARVRHDPLNE